MGGPSNESKDVEGGINQLYLHRIAVETTTTPADPDQDQPAKTKTLKYHLRITDNLQVADGSLVKMLEINRHLQITVENPQYPKKGALKILEATGGGIWSEPDGSIVDDGKGQSYGALLLAIQLVVKLENDLSVSIQILPIVARIGDTEGDWVRAQDLTAGEGNYILNPGDRLPETPIYIGDDTTDVDYINIPLLLAGYFSEAEVPDDD